VGKGIATVIAACSSDNSYLGLDGPMRIDRSLEIGFGLRRSRTAADLNLNISLIIRRE
jgi:hypothetical protein